MITHKIVKKKTHRQQIIHSIQSIVTLVLLYVNFVSSLRVIKTQTAANSRNDEAIQHFAGICQNHLTVRQKYFNALNE